MSIKQGIQCEVIPLNNELSFLFSIVYDMNDPLEWRKLWQEVCNLSTTYSQHL